nr:hypothetical protein [Bacteroidota bacterium]
MRNTFLFLLLLILVSACNSVKENTDSPTKELSPFVLMVQPIVVQSDSGSGPAPMNLPEDLIDGAYEKAGVDFHFLEPIYYNSTSARDGLINLDQIVENATESGLLRGQEDIVNMFFVNAVDGHKGPLGRGMQGGNITFIVLGDADPEQEDLIYMQAFVIAHEVGHNLSLIHAVDDSLVPDTIPNLQGDGAFKDRVDPKFSLNDHQIKIILNSPLVRPRIDLLSKEDGQTAILDESFEPYFSQLQAREIAAFTGEKAPNSDPEEARLFAREKFSSAVTDFSDKEKACILWAVNEVNNILLENKLSLMAGQPWRFIKIEGWLCGGFGHTRGTFIILSQKHMDHLIKGWSDEMSTDEKNALLKKFGGLLVHEQMHTLQRVFKSKFTQLYTERWNFIQAFVKPENEIVVNQLSNPDAPIPEWLVPDDKDGQTLYWVRTLLKEGPEIPVMGKDFQEAVFEIVRENRLYKVRKDQEGKLVQLKMSDIPAYALSFPVSRGIDHPNEISAYMFSTYFQSLVEGTIPFQDAVPEAEANIEAFMNWMNDEMGDREISKPIPIPK